MKKRQATGDITVQVTGGEDDAFMRSVVHHRLQAELRKLKKILPIEELIVHVDRRSKGDGKSRYMIKARLITGKGLFFAQSEGWDLPAAVRASLDRLEREVLKKKGKRNQRAV